MAKHHVAVLEMDIRVAQPRMRYFDDDIIRPQLTARRVFVDTPALGALENGIFDGHGDDRGIGRDEEEREEESESSAPRSSKLYTRSGKLPPAS